VRPHRDKYQVLEDVNLCLCGLSAVWLGIPALLAVPVGFATWLIAERELARLESGRTDGGGKAQALAIRRLGLATLWFSLACAGVWLFAFLAYFH
jgi:hypothetical protein